MKIIPQTLTAFRRQTAFTMVEIALALAVIGFALVAIVGVLPMGMEVQKQNREDTIIDHDANVLLEAIRNGARGLDDLTNYVFEIRRTNWLVDVAALGKPNQPPPKLDGYYVFTYDGKPSKLDGAPAQSNYPLNTGLRIIGLLGLPKYQRNGSDVSTCFSNNVFGYVRALSGAATEKPPQSNPAVQDLGFNYRLGCEISQFVTPPFTNAIEPVLRTLPETYPKNLTTNLHEVRLVVRWPLLPRGNPGPSREIYRGLVGGRPYPTNEFAQVGQDLFFFRPQFYKRVDLP